MKKLLFLCIVSVLSLSPQLFATEASDKSPSAKVTTAERQQAININTADVQTLTQLKGVGLKKAEEIVAWRKANGNFKTVEQLAEVKGISEKTVELNRAIIRLQ